MANIPDTPITRQETYLDAIANGTTEVPEPITREEQYLAWIALNGGGGGGTGEVKGVKGDVENSYRKNNVNLTLANITNIGDGLEYVAGTKTLKSTIQSAVMPTPASVYRNRIVQYTGETTSSYTNGYFYKCTQDGGTYKWEEVSLGDAPEELTTEQVNALLALIRG